MANIADSLSFQDLILTLQSYWSKQGWGRCTLPLSCAHLGQSRGTWPMFSLRGDLRMGVMAITLTVFSITISFKSS